jgi:hypothetical protein
MRRLGERRVRRREWVDGLLRREGVEGKGEGRERRERK